MEVTQLKDLVTKAVAQTTGTEIEALKTYELLDMGKDVMDAGQIEEFTKALINQVGKIVVMSEKYTADLPDLFIESWEWGAYLERVYPDINDYDVNNSWDLVDGKQYPAHIFYQPNVSAKIYEELKTIETRISIAGNEQIQTAFTSWSEMNRFVGGIQESIENTLEIALEGMGEMLITSAIAISDKATSTAVHLLTDYNNEFSTNLTKDECLNNIGFLRYVAKTIHLYRMRIARMTKGLFNNGNINAWTRGDNQKLVCLADFIANLNTLLLGDTYHEEKYSIGDFKEVPYWQSPVGSSTSFTLSDNSAIKIDADADNKLGIGTQAYENDGAIALLYDRRAIGTSMNKRKTTSEYTPSADFWTYYHKLTGNYIIDSNFPMVAFFID